ncbi:MAG: response regulator [Deltaproteobacteria bacterium]|jgi:two-component system KDP operon response regulator KdpE|nr:response regulator [Deltaproteobacteria bacterium]
MSNDVRILLIDDEQAIRNIVKMSLEGNGYKIAEAVDGKSGMEKVSEFHPHLVLLDLGLPDMNGLEVLKTLRKWTRVPIIILTVMDGEQVKVQLLDAGADDYLTKPFGAKELLARVRVALRNIGLIEATPIFISDDLEVDLSQKKVIVSGKEIKLTATEYEVLSRLVRDHGKVVPQTQLLKQIWGSLAEDQSHYLRIYVNQLRKKIEKNPSEPKHLLTEPGVGYRLI